MYILRHLGYFFLYLFPGINCKDKRNNILQRARTLNLIAQNLSIDEGRLVAVVSLTQTLRHPPYLIQCLFDAFMLSCHLCTLIVYSLK